MIDINNVTGSSLRVGKWHSELPEYYELKERRENNLWHQTEDSIFEHAVRVYENLEKAFDLKFLQPPVTSLLENYLVEKISSHTREELLKIATILHDIAKTDTWYQKPDGTTACPDHETIGSSRVELFQDRFNLSPQELSLVKDIVLYHGTVGNLGSIAGKNPDLSVKYLKILKEVIPNVLPEVLLLVYSDIAGCDVFTTDPAEATSRTNQIVTWLNSLFNPK